MKYIGNKLQYVISIFYTSIHMSVLFYLMDMHMFKLYISLLYILLYIIVITITHCDNLYIKLIYK